jgi:hypothetical protein
MRARAVATSRSRRRRAPCAAIVVALLSVASEASAFAVGPVSTVPPAALSASPAAGPGDPSGLAQPIDAELERLGDLLAKLPRAPQMERSFAECREGLARVRAARSVELRLFRLRAPFVQIETLAYVAIHSEMGVDVEHLATLWQQVGQRPPASAPPRPGPLLLVALADAAHNKAEKLYRASLPYGKVAGPGQGLYYLAQGEALRRFGDWASRVAALVPAHDLPPTREALAAALAELQAASLVDFDKAPGGFDLVPVSAGLKEAGELLRAGSYEATALALLEARFALTAAEAETGRSRGKQDVQPSPSALACSDTLCALYVAAANEATDKAVTRGIVETVLPLYTTIFRRTP